MNGSTHDAVTNDEHRRLVSYEAPVSVPRISTQLIISAGEPENEAMRCLLLEPPTDPSQMRGLRFVILATDGVEELELTVPYKFIAERGGTVHLVSPRFEMPPAKFGVQYPQMRATHIMTVRWMENAGWFPIDRFLDEVKVSDYDVLIIPGGTWNPDALRSTPTAVNFVKDFYQSGKVTASICHGPWVFVSAGILQGKQATANWPIHDDLRNAGAIVIDEPVVVDGNLITSRHPIDLPPFMEAIAVAVKKATGAAQHSFTS
jgi:protease I